MWMRWIAVCSSAALISLNIFAESEAGADAAESRPEPEFPALEPGQSGTIALGSGVELALVWIEALKFWVGKYEVTNGQYRRFNTSHVSKPWARHVLDGDDQPAVYVSWNQARQYCAWLTRRIKGKWPEGWLFRLPSAKEWETCARCGDTREFPWGNEWPPPNDWNYRGEEGLWAPARLFTHDKVIRGHTDKFVVSAPVASSGSNILGVFGMGGNVWEWCRDEFSEEYGTRVIMGGCWDNYQRHLLKTDWRSECAPNGTNQVIGFRVVLAPPDSAAP